MQAKRTVGSPWPVLEDGLQLEFPGCEASMFGSLVPPISDFAI